jgi:hypothetical protein
MEVTLSTVWIRLKVINWDNPKNFNQIADGPDSQFVLIHDLAALLPGQNRQTDA